MTDLQIITGDCRTVLRTLEAGSVQCCVTSPPYWGLRDYGTKDQLGLEPTPEAYVGEMVRVFREVWRVLRDDGTLWLNLGDSYAGAGYSNHANTGGAQVGDGGKQKHTRCGSGRADGIVTSDSPRNRDGIGGVKGLKPKDLIGIPWRVALALQSDGWWLRQDIIWHKPNPMPESVTDRCTKAHEYLFLLTKSERYFYDADAIAEPQNFPERRYNPDTSQQKCATIGLRLQGGLHDGREQYGNGETRNRRSVWTVATSPYPESHFATFPPDLIKPCILAGSKAGDTVLDPFAGSGTTGMVALEYGRKSILIELNPEYAKLAQGRCNVTPGLPLP